MTITEPDWSVAKTWMKTVTSVDVPGGPHLEDPPAPFTSKFTPVQDHSLTVLYEDSGRVIPADFKLTVWYLYTFEIGQETWLYESSGFVVGYDSRERHWLSPGSRRETFGRCRISVPPGGGGGGGGNPD